MAAISASKRPMRLLSAAQDKAAAADKSATKSVFFMILSNPGKTKPRTRQQARIISDSGRLKACFLPFGRQGFIAFAFCVLFPYSFILAGEVTDNYETAFDKIADAYIGKSVPGACVIVSEHGEIVFSRLYNI